MLCSPLIKDTEIVKPLLAPLGMYIVVHFGVSVIHKLPFNGVIFKVSLSSVLESSHCCPCHVALALHTFPLDLNEAHSKTHGCVSLFLIILQTAQKYYLCSQTINPSEIDCRDINHTLLPSHAMLGMHIIYLVQDPQSTCRCIVWIGWGFCFISCTMQIGWNTYYYLRACYEDYVNIVKAALGPALTLMSFQNSNYSDSFKNIHCGFKNILEDYGFVQSTV